MSWSCLIRKNVRHTAEIGVLKASIMLPGSGWLRVPCWIDHFSKYCRLCDINLLQVVRRSAADCLEQLYALSEKFPNTKTTGVFLFLNRNIIFIPCPCSFAVL